MTHTLHQDHQPDTFRLSEPAAACTACPHPLGDHDAIALRFCRATSAARLDRGCVCRPA